MQLPVLLVNSKWSGDYDMDAQNRLISERGRWWWTDDNEDVAEYLNKVKCYQTGAITPTRMP